MGVEGVSVPLKQVVKFFILESSRKSCREADREPWQPERAVTGREGAGGPKPGLMSAFFALCAHHVQGGAWKINLGALPTSPHLSLAPRLTSSSTDSLSWQALPAPLPPSLLVSNEMCHFLRRAELFPCVYGGCHRQGFQIRRGGVGRRTGGCKARRAQPRVGRCPLGA